MTTSLSYSNDIIQILEKDCYICHNSQANFGNVSIDQHSKLMQYVNNGRLIGSIKHTSGFSPMPKGRTKLLDCEVAKIEAWIIDGAPNN